MAEQTISILSGIEVRWRLFRIFKALALLKRFRAKYKQLSRTKKKFLPSKSKPSSSKL